MRFDRRGESLERYFACYILGFNGSRGTLTNRQHGFQNMKHLKNLVNSGFYMYNTL
jgi:hypothetical protein